MEFFSYTRKTGTWAEINLDNIGFNLKSVKESLDENTAICCVVKANAYGHGSVEVAKYLETQPGVDYLSVARFEEAMELRRNGISLPILCMGYTYVGDMDEAIKNNITLTIYNLEMAERLNEFATKLGRKAKVHVKIDSGMSRLGFLVNDKSIEDIKQIHDTLKMLELEGMYTHFAKADEEDKVATMVQLEGFKDIVNGLSEVDIKYKHVSNSAASLDLKELGFNMIRLGISLYGYYPSEEVSRNVKLKPALKVKTVVTNIKNVPENTGVSYGHVYVTDKNTRIGTLAVGYADGYPRTQDSPKVFLNGSLVKVIGRICMDQCMIEIPEDLEVKIGDEVIIMGDIPGITVEDIAKQIGTISYEILCMMSRRVVRYYTSCGVVESKSYMQC